MLALVKAECAPDFILAQIPIPCQGPDELLVRVQASSICGTDLHIYKWDDWAAGHVQVPNVVGHEFSGTVVAVGEQVQGFKPGDSVSAEGHVACGNCKLCRTGETHVCRHTRSFGITLPGCFAEYAVIKASQAIVNPQAWPHTLSCLQDPLGNAVQSVLAGEIVGKSVAVIGSGAIGLMAIMVARACGAGRIFAADIHEYRLQMAQEAGADEVIDSRHVSLADELLRLTDGEGVEVLLEMSGHPSAISDGMRGLSNAGRVSLLGIPTEAVSLDIARDIVFKGAKVMGITGRRMYETWYQVQGLLGAGKLPLEKIVTHRFALHQYKEAFELLASGACGKIVFDDFVSGREQAVTYDFLTNRSSDNREAAHG